jgi:two-component system sensor histidine kinase BaeS
MDELRPLALRHDVSLVAVAQPTTITGDPDRLHDLVANLLFNGVSYNRPGGTVAVDVRSDGQWADVRVRDSGIGISPVDLPRIFDRFYRAAPAREREPAGAGLGLALARWIATAHGGSITCSSEPGRFAEFLVRLPASVPQAMTGGRP